MRRQYFVIAIIELIAIGSMLSMLARSIESVAWADAIRGPSCSVTADSNILAGVLGPIPGEAPVWFASGSGGVWHREQPEKSILALARTASGRLRVEGHRLDKSGVLSFKREFDAPAHDVLEVLDPWHGSMRPGGPLVAQQFAFVPMYVVYPSAGCWELNVRVGSRTIRIITLLRTEVSAALDRKR